MASDARGKGARHRVDRVRVGCGFTVDLLDAHPAAPSRIRFLCRRLKTLSRSSRNIFLSTIDKKMKDALDAS